MSSQLSNNIISVSSRLSSHSYMYSRSRLTSPMAKSLSWRLGKCGVGISYKLRSFTIGVSVKISLGDTVDA